VRRPAPTIAYIHRRVGDIARDRGLPAPGYTTVRQIVHAIDPGLTALADGGDAAYRDKFELVYRRTTTAPNEQWQMDHTLLDVMILDDKQTPVRPWLTIVLDDYSRAVAGYALAVSAPTSERSALAFHQAASRKRHASWVVSGLPDVLYSDHGSDFTSARIEQVCLDLHVRLIHSRVGVPQGRGKIERFYRTITTELLRTYLASSRTAPAVTRQRPHVDPAPARRRPRAVHRRRVQRAPALRDRDGTARAGAAGASSRVCPHTRKTSTCCC
jgi:putative transposase